MIGKPEWFTRRKYTGWGFTPVTWQGWAYVLVMILPIVVITGLHIFGTWQVVFLFAWALIFSADFVHIALNLKKDERDRIHEAIAERNALWVILIALIVGVGYQTASGIVADNVVKVDPVILIAIFAGLIAKVISNVYLDKKD